MRRLTVGQPQSAKLVDRARWTRSALREIEEASYAEHAKTIPVKSTGGIEAKNVQDALAELDNELTALTEVVTDLGATVTSDQIALHAQVFG